LRNYQQYGLEKCQSLSARPLDDLIREQILQVLKPASVELSVQAVEETKQERRRLTKLRSHRLERAQFEVDRAARQYHAVEPENRLVARQLERLWEEAMQAQREIEEDLRRLEHSQPVELKPHELDMIQKLSNDLPVLWNATGTTAADRQTIIRHLVDRVVVDVQGESEHVDVAIHWSGGFVSQHSLIRPIASYEQLSGYRVLRRVTLFFFVLFFSSFQLAEMSFPATFEFAGDESIVRIRLHELSLCKLSLVAEAIDLLSASCQNTCMFSIRRLQRLCSDINLGDA